MLNFALISIAVAVIGYSMLIALVRKLSKSRIRGITHLVSAVLAVVTTLGLKSTLTSEDTMNQLRDALTDADLSIVADFMGASNTLSEVLLKCLAALVAPMLCFILYLVYLGVTWVIYMILTLIIRPLLKRHDQFAKHASTRALIWGAVSGLVTVFMIFIPIASYIDIAVPVLETVRETTELESDANKLVRTYLDESITASKSGVIVTYRFLGGKAVCGALGDFEVDGEKVSLGQEAGAVAGFVQNVMHLTDTKMENMNHQKAKVFGAMADSFEASVLLPTIVGDVVYEVTGHWMQGETFAGMAPVKLGDDAEVAQPVVDKLIVILHDDAHNKQALEADLRTVGNIVSISADYGIFKKFSDTDILVVALGNQDFLNTMLAEISSNNSMKNLMPEITNMAFRSIANSMDVPDGNQEAYNQMMGDIAGSLNDVKNLSKEERNAQLTLDVEKALNDAGVTVVDEQKDILADYVDDMATELIDKSGKETITEEDVKMFLATHVPQTT